jgi:drug/metabolite transporter (DMT)-like permease
MARARLRAETETLFSMPGGPAMSTLSRPLGAAALLAATFAWGSLFLVGKPVLDQVDPVWFTLARYTIATVGFAALLLVRGAFPWDKLRTHGWRLAGLGIVGYGAFGILVLTGLAHSQPSHGAVVMATMPITTQLVRWVFDGVRPGLASLAGTVLALAGVVTVSGVLAGPSGADSTLAGDLIAFAGTLGWIAYTRGSARFGTFDVLEFSALTAIASWPLLLLATLAATALHWAAVPTWDALGSSWHALLYIGVAPTILGVLAFNAGVKALGVVTGTAFLNFVPVSAVLIGVALGARPAAHELVGVVMVAVALGVHTLSLRQPASPAGPLRRCAA